MTDSALQFRGGRPGAVLPFLLFVAGVVWLALQGAPSEKGFWPILVAAIVAGLLLAKDPRAYCEAVLEGMSRRITMIMVTAWMLASVLGVLMQEAGFVESLTWSARQLELDGRGYVAGAFLVCCLVSASTGTSLGTLLLCGPLLYPSGILLGSPAALLAGAILAGATFGDSISPISDTTIASALTQKADIGGTVRSRLVYAVPAALVALLLYLAVAVPLPAAASPESQPSASAAGLPMALVPVLVLALLFRGRHLLEGLSWGLLTGTVLALLLGLLAPERLLDLDAQAYTATSFVIDGIDRSVGIIVFTILLLGLVGTLEASGLVEGLMQWVEPRVRTVRGSEAAISGTAAAAVLLTTHSVVALLMVGEFARRIGRDRGIHRYRRANLLDLTVVTFPFLLPYCIPVILTASLTATAERYGSSPVPAWQAGLLNFYSLAVLAVLVLAIGTGYGRRQAAGSQPDEIP